MGRLLRLVETGRFDPTVLLTRRYRFEDVERAFADVAARTPGHIKPLITFCAGGKQRVTNDLYDAVVVGAVSAR